MPEGDTVWQAARRLHDALAGHVLVRSDLRVPRFATSDLTGRSVLDVTARGKHLLTRIEGGLTLHSHLRMDGSWRIYAPGQRWNGGPAHQIRAVLANAERTAVGYRLPVLELIRTEDEEDRAVGHLGPDLLGPDWDADLALANLAKDPDRELGEALLDQRNLAGIGNVFKSELCFLLNVTPWLPVGELPADRMASLPELARKLLEFNRDRTVRNTTGRRARTSTSTAAPAAPACAAAPRSGWPSRATAHANAPRTGAPSASRDQPRTRAARPPGPRPLTGTSSVPSSSHPVPRTSPRGRPARQARRHRPAASAPSARALGRQCTGSTLRPHPPAATAPSRAPAPGANSSRPAAHHHRAVNATAPAHRHTRARPRAQGTQDGQDTPGQQGAPAPLRRPLRPCHPFAAWNIQ